MWEDLVQIDRDIFSFFNGLWIGQFTDFWLFVTQIEHWIPLYLFFFVLLYQAMSWRKGLASIGMVLTTAVFTLWLTDFVKNNVERLRPNNEPMLMDSINIAQMPENFSFWSGHSAVSFAATTIVVFLLQHYKPSKWYYLFYIWPITFALSRMFVGVHYPADVTVGMLVGLTAGFLFYKLTILLFETLDDARKR
ncbi:undecaprenyl-diphosphatase [Nonlabens sp. Hel1_33_55]|uniref:phosphatase PAP2 family protein n=1 Tax=Nonlabens sp. Hel1_33_55 TaxID=1336802 RepID=UPI000875E836|nr:phosphatase PAP2 family protein [Nonlabens sp. Hel1_33_55]SCY40606.1 undecaprenyl-diphosphatase [Nonlabens sp. Hel1_33_55]